MNTAKTMLEFCAILKLALGPSKFAVDPAAENGDVPLYACSRSFGLASDDHVLQRLGKKSEGPGALL